MRFPMPSSRWLLVGSLWVLLTAANAYYIVPSGLLSVIMDRLAVGPTAASLLVSVMFGTQVVVGVPIGMLLDRVDNRTMIAVATLVLVVAYVWSWQAAVAGHFEALLVSRSVATIGTAAVWTASVNVVGQQFRPERRATAVGAITSAPPAGFAVGLVTGPIVADWFDWTAIFAVYALPAAVGCLCFWFVTRDTGIAVGDTASFRPGDLTRLLTSRAIWLVASMAFLGFSLYAFVTTWAPTYLAEQLELSLVHGGLFAALFPAIGIFARGGSGYLSDRLFDHRRRPVAILSFAVAVPSIVLIVRSETIAFVVASLLLAGFFVQLGLGLFYAQARELADERVVATAVGFTTSFAVFGGFIAPIAGGYLIEYSGYSMSFGFAVVVAVLGVLLAVLVPEPNV